MSKPRLLLVGWDAADWKLIHPLIDSGRMPTLQRIVEDGVSGPLASMEPSLSPLLWTSIATGKRAYDHGIHGFTQVDPLSGRVVPMAAADRRCKALWEILEERGLKSHVIGWLATQGEQGTRGSLISDLYPKILGSQAHPNETPLPAPPGTYWPEALRSVLDPLRVQPGDIDGDAILRLFVPDAPKVNQARDRRLWHLAEHLARAFSIQAAACHLLENDPHWDFTAVYYPAIDEIGHEFMEFHPPQLEGVRDEEFQLYHRVMEGAYRLHDLLLTRLLQLAGPDTAVMVVSDHGFHSDHRRPRHIPEVSSGITAWHRPQGVVAAWGPGFATDALVHGARLLDITPTLLAWFGLPVGADMEGRVLREAFAKPPQVTTIPTWEGRETERRRCALSREEEEQVVQQLRDLGYLEDVSKDPTENAERTRLENTWNLARAFLDGGRPMDALPLLEEVYFHHPERNDFAQTLALCQRQLGLLEESRSTIATCLDSCGDSDLGRLIRARFETESGNTDEALEILNSIRSRAPRDLATLELMGLTLLHLRQWERCAEVCRTALEIDSNNVTAWLGLARCALSRRLPKEAVGHALEAIGRQYGSAQGHFLLGVALWQDRQFKEAAVALRAALRFDPRLDSAGRILASVLRELGDPVPTTESIRKSPRPRSRSIPESDPRLQALRSAARQRDIRRCSLRQERRNRMSQGKVEATFSGLPAGQEFVIVSGLPRSGTSLMMQMLQAGGLPPMTDGKRAADPDNPEGYLEWEAIRQLPRTPHLIERAQGHAVKVISALLGHLPGQHRYKILFMDRPIDDVMASQARMRQRRHGEVAGDSPVTRSALERHLSEIRKSLKESPNIEVLEISYPSLVSDPETELSRITRFLGPSHLPQPQAMARCVRPTLHRNRSETLPAGPAREGSGLSPRYPTPQHLTAPPTTTAEVNSVDTLGKPGRPVTFRWAWPDERSRAALLFPSAALTEPAASCFVATVEHPVERIVGVAWCQDARSPDSIPTGLFLWAMLPGITGTTTEREFLEAFVSESAKLRSFERLRTARTLPESPASHLLTDLGFEPAYTIDTYQTPGIQSCCDRLKHVLDRIRDSQVDLEVMSPLPEHRDALIQLASHRHPLMSAPHIDATLNGADGCFEPKNSAVVFHGGQMIGAILATITSDGWLQIPVLACDGRPGIPDGIILSCLLEHLRRSLPVGFPGGIRFQTNPTVSPTMPNFGRRMKFEKVASATAWRLRVSPS